MRDVRVRVERDVGERHAVADEPVAPGQPALQRVERPVAGRHAIGQPLDVVAPAARSTRARSGPRRSPARGRTARRTSTAGPGRARTALPARSASLRRSTSRSRRTRRAAARRRGRASARAAPGSDRRAAPGESERSTTSTVCRSYAQPEMGQQQPHLVTVARHRAVVEEHAVTIAEAIRAPVSPRGSVGARSRTPVGATRLLPGWFTRPICRSARPGTPSGSLTNAIRPPPSRTR